MHSFFMNYFLVIIAVFVYIYAFFANNYLINAAATLILIIGLYIPFDLGIFTIIIALIPFVFVANKIRKYKSNARWERDVYNQGANQAKFSKIFDRGFNDEYYDK